MHPYDKFKSDNPVPERSAFDLTELNRKDLDNAELIERLKNIPVGIIRDSVVQTNVFQFDGSQVFEHCTVLTIDGVPGFAWYDPATGQRHDEGFTWPTMQIHKDATVEVLFGPDGERSAGWKKNGYDE